MKKCRICNNEKVILKRVGTGKKGFAYFPCECRKK